MTAKARTYVYCIQEQCRDAFAPIKIGVATTPRDRMENLQVGNPMPLGIYGLIGPLTRQAAQRMESDLHVAMSKHRIRGEWFSGRAIPHFDEAQAIYAHRQSANGHSAGTRECPLYTPALPGEAV